MVGTFLGERGTCHGAGRKTHTRSLVSWDDDFFITPNRVGLSWLLPWRYYELVCKKDTTIVPAYYPVFHLSLALDRSVWGRRACGYHVTNLVLHTCNVLLVFWLGRRLIRQAESSDGGKSLGTALGGALLFALHPVNVEPVAWG